MIFPDTHASVKSPEQPLSGLRVLELGALVAAPYAGMLLSDLGAEVIKVEPPEGDMAREFPPFVEGESAFFMSVNRGKRSVRLNLKDPDALAWVIRMAQSSDVLLHNYRTGVAERLGLGYDDLKVANPGLVYCAISGFGPTGPMASRPAIDLLFQAESGMLAITGEPGGKPVKVGTNAADVYAATMATACINAALVKRATSGLGCRVDVSLRDAFLALQANWFSSFLATGIQPSRLGTASPFTAPTEVFPTRDSHIVLAVVNDKHWHIFCKALGLVNEERFETNEGRVKHAGELRTAVIAALAHSTTDAWLTVLDEAGIPAGRVMDYEAVTADPQIQHNQMVLSLDHPAAGEIRVQGVPFWFDGRKHQPIVAPPTLGQHTKAVLADFGCDEETAARLASVR